MSRDIVVNGRFLVRRVTGVERHAHEILRCMGMGCRLEATPAQGWRGHLWEQCSLPARLRRDSVLWSPANTGPLVVRRQALTVHDLSPLEHPEWFRESFAAWYRLVLPILVRRVEQVFTPSEYVRQKVLRRFNLARVAVTPNGVDGSLFHPGAPQLRNDIPSQYILFVGTLEPRKNLEHLIQAWNQLKTEFRDMWLVIVGVSGRVFKSVQVPHPLERVRFLGYVDDETLAGLYANATVFALPSREEGFGLPALEAMASGTPVIVSDGGALPEVVSDAGLRFCLADPYGLQAALHECLSNRPLRSALIEKGLERAKVFSWQATAETVWRSLHDL